MKTIYGIYQQARNASWQFLIDNNISSLPLNVMELCQKYNIRTVKNSIVKELKPDELGVCIYDRNNWYIVYDDTADRQTVRHTIAHELGHIFLGHPLKSGYLARTADKVKTDLEWQAERFAIGILAPACVIWGLDLHTAEDISKACDISLKAAQTRAKRMKTLYERNKFLTSPLEKEVFDNFAGFIENGR